MNVDILKDTIYHAGQVVGLVVAESEYAAQKAAKLVVVTYKVSEKD